MRKIEPTLESDLEIGLGEKIGRPHPNASGENIGKNKQNPSKPAILESRRKKYIYMEKNGCRHCPIQIFFHLSVNLDSFRQ